MARLDSGYLHPAYSFQDRPYPIVHDLGYSIRRLGWRRRYSSTNHPTGSAEAYFSAVYIGIKGWTNRLNNPCTRLFICLLKDHANRAELRQVRGQLLLWHGARDIDGLDRNVGPIALFQDAVDSMLVREGKLPRYIWPSRWKHR